MHKKIIMACMAIAAFAAFVVAPSASAVQIGETSGSTFTPLEVGKLITGTQLGASKMTSGPLPTSSTLVECSTGIMTGKLTENGLNTIKGEITSASFSNAGGADCSSSFGTTTAITTKFEDAGNVQTGVPWCLATNKGTDNFEVTGGSCGAPRALKFIMDTSAFGECEYSKETGVSGTFTTDISPANEDAKLKVGSSGNGPFKKIRGSFFCPSEGYLQMEFTLETDSATVTPLYIK